MSGVRDEIEKIALRMDKEGILQLLQELEWAGGPHHITGGVSSPLCRGPARDHFDPDRESHAPDCRLNYILRREGR